MKKICFFAHSNNLTGANRSMLDLVEKIGKSDRKISVTVVIPMGGDIEKKLLERGIKYKIIRSFNLTYRKKELEIISRTKIVIKRILNIFCERRLKKFIKKNDFDLIHLNSMLTFVAAKIANKSGIPYIWHLRDFIQEDHGWYFYNDSEMRHLLNNANRCIAISNAVENTFKKRYDLTNIIRVYNGVPKERYYFDRKKIEAPLNICVIGRLSVTKDQLTVLKAFRRIKNSDFSDKYGKLFVVGSAGEDELYKSKLQNYVLNNFEKDDVIFVEHTDDVLSFRKKADIAIIPSWQEAFGRVTIEAMFAQQCVIATDSGANPELVKDNFNGFLFKKKDDSQLFEILCAVTEDLNKIEKVQKEGCEFALENFPISKTAEQVLEIYRKVLL